MMEFKKGMIDPVSAETSDTATSFKRIMEGIGQEGNGISLQKRSDVFEYNEKTAMGIFNNKFMRAINPTLKARLALADFVNGDESKPPPHPQN